MSLTEGIDLVKDITATQQEVLGTNPQRIYALLVNDGTEDIYLGKGRPAVANRGIRLNASGGNYEINTTNPWHGSIHAVCGAGLTSSLMIQEN